MPGLSRWITAAGAALSALFTIAGTAVDDGVRRSLRELTARAASGDAEALYQLARVHERGFDSIPADTAGALRLLHEAARLGHPAAQNLYGFHLYNGLGADADMAAGLEWMEKAAMAGDVTAANNLGWLLLEGKTNRHDAADAAYWFARAAEKGMPQAQTMLADLYMLGRGVEADTVKARELYNAAISKGFADAAYKLLDMDGDMWRTTLTPEQAVGLGLKYYPAPAPALGVVLFAQAAEAGNARAHALLGDALTRAVGADYDHDKSILHYYIAARDGNSPAQFVVGELLEIFPDALDILPDIDPSLEVREEEKQASFWLERAAAGGVTDAATAARRLLEKPEEPQ